MILCALCVEVFSADDDFLRLHSRVIVHEGEAGLFLDAEDSEKISRWKEVLRLTNEERALLEARIALEQEALKDCEEVAQACETEKKRLKVKVKKARTGAGFLGVLLILALL